MNFWMGVGAAALVTVSAPALAGDEVLYGAAPAWVQPADVGPLIEAGGPSEILFDWQHRLERGTVTSYRDRAVRIDNLDALTDEGTIQLTWSPDKGDLTIHRLEIIRDGKVIDLLGQGVKFETLRREEGLEQRLLDGQLTATVAVPGLKEGDVLRIAHSTTLSDQALGSEMQALQYLPPKPWRVGMGRTIVSWPVGEAISWRAEPDVPLEEPVTRDGYRYLTVAFPIPKRDEMPDDAPSRFTRPPILRVGTFADWRELSRVMEPHFAAAATIEDKGELAGEVRKIMAVSRDPLKRAELALRLVQDQVSYLLDGLDGGNYLPQHAEETWDKRYGDCKAKSVLLMAMLRRMGITADVVLAKIDGGDAIPDLLPIPADFDHMIVRANIGGEDYWLDGTSTATRLTNIAEVPPFGYVLPLRPEGADLAPLTRRAPTYPDIAADIVFDHSPDRPADPVHDDDEAVRRTRGAAALGGR